MNGNTELFDPKRPDDGLPGPGTAVVLTPDAARRWRLAFPATLPRLGSLAYRPDRRRMAVAVSAALGASLLLFYPAPQYASVASFVLRSDNAPSALPSDGSLENARIFAAYLRSADAVRDLADRIDLRGMLDRPEADRLSRFPGPLADASDEALRNHIAGRIELDIEEASGILTLTALAHRPIDAKAIGDALLLSAEALANGLGTRARLDREQRANHTLEEAQHALFAARDALAAFRVETDLLDPALVAREDVRLEGVLGDERTRLSAEIERLRRLAPDSPRLAALEQRLRSGSEWDRAANVLVRTTASLAVAASAYELLVLQRDLAAAAVESAAKARETARHVNDASRVYLHRVSEPSLADRPEWPGRGRLLLALACLAVLAISLVSARRSREAWVR